LFMLLGDFPFLLMLET